MKILVTGAGGFIGGHLVKELVKRGHTVRAADIKPFDDWYQLNSNAFNFDKCDLRNYENCLAVVEGIEQVYNLAADMGGMGFIESHKADCMMSVLINTHLLKAAQLSGVQRYFFSSSACAYRVGLQQLVSDVALKEADAYPADAEDGYGWEKLFSERMCRHFREDYKLETRIARYHNVYGPYGTWEGGREKAPAAMCRKIAELALGIRSEVDVWGRGQQRRSFMWVGDCVKGTIMIMESEFSDPINLGSDLSITIDNLVYRIGAIAGIPRPPITYVDGPLGVGSRNSDNSLIRRTFQWEPCYPLDAGLAKTYEWVYDQVKAKNG